MLLENKREREDEDAVRFLLCFNGSMEQKVYVYAASLVGGKEGKKEMKLL